MTEAATRKDVAQMSDREMVDELAAMFDVADPLPNEQQEDQAAEEVEATAVEGDEATSEETEADEGQEAEATEELEVDQTDDLQDERWMPNSLEELAEALETQPDQVLDTMKIKVKADGVESEATLKDVVANYQIRKTLDQRLEAQANERKAFEAQAAERLKQLDERLQNADGTVNALEQMLFQDYQAVNWSELKTDDPTEYMLKQQEMRDRYSSLQEVKSKLQADREAEQKKYQEEMKGKMQEYVQAQVAEAQRKIPEWRDQKQMMTDLKDIQEYLLKEGATQEELAQTVDHRLYVMAMKAMKYDKMQTKADPKMKQMKTKPKFVKPGTRKDPARTSQKRKDEAFARAKKLQTDDAWTEALLAKLS